MESGQHGEHDEKQNLNRIEETGKKQGNSIWNRKRALGGTTIAWGGQSLPFCPIDFEERSWVSNSGWPINFEELESHYQRANAFMGVDNRDYRDEAATWLNRPNPGFAPELIGYHFSKWAPQPNFFKRHHRRLTRHVTVCTNTQALRMERGVDHRVTAVEVSNFKQQTARLECRHVLIAAGGIETNRLLLLAERDYPRYSGNHSGKLGRGFMDHPTFTAGAIRPNREFNLQRDLGTQLKRHWKYSVRLSAAPDWQRQTQHLNLSAGMLFGYPPDKSDWFETLKTTVRRPTPENFTKLWRDRSHAFVGLTTFVKDRFIFRPEAESKLWLMGEQLPDPNSRITLGEDRDQFDLPIARLHWRISPETWHTMSAFSSVLKSEIERLGYGHIALDPSLTDDNVDIAKALERLGDVNHHMGGTRMSLTPEEGVVDPHLKVWGCQTFTSAVLQFSLPPHILIPL